jgi:release factor glutamine methyltransferase
VIRPTDVVAAAATLARAGFLAPDAEAAELTASAIDSDDLRARVARRTSGEPLAWITGSTTFCGEVIRIDPGVYVPRPQSQPMAEAAVANLPADGVAVDLCTGSGAIAVVLARRRPGARVLAIDVDPTAVRCARANGVEAFEADVAATLPDVAATLPDGLAGSVDVVTAVVPYVPSDALHLLPRDVLAHEPRLALDGGEAGTLVLHQAVGAAAELLRHGGCLLLELGGDQDRHLLPILEAQGFTDVGLHHDDDGDLRWLRARWTDVGSGPLGGPDGRPAN